MEYLKIALIVGLASFTAWIGYEQGKTCGRKAYQHSRDFQLTMNSMYIYGWWDGRIYQRYNPPFAGALK